MAIPISEARRDLVSLMELVNLDHTQVEIMSRRGSAVLMSNDEYGALVETSYLLNSPRNAQRLISALESFREVEPSGTSFENRDRTRLAIYVLVQAIIFLRLRIAELKRAQPPKEGTQRQ